MDDLPPAHCCPVLERRENGCSSEAVKHDRYNRLLGVLLLCCHVDIHPGWHQLSPPFVQALCLVRVRSLLALITANLGASLGRAAVFSLRYRRLQPFARHSAPPTSVREGATYMIKPATSTGLLSLYGDTGWRGLRSRSLPVDVCTLSRHHEVGRGRRRRASAAEFELPSRRRPTLPGAGQKITDEAPNNTADTRL